MGNLMSVLNKVSSVLVAVCDPAVMVSFLKHPFNQAPSSIPTITLYPVDNNIMNSRTGLKLSGKFEVTGKIEAWDKAMTAIENRGVHSGLRSGSNGFVFEAPVIAPSTQHPAPSTQQYTNYYPY